VDHYREQNKLAAKLILQDVQRHGEEGSLMVVWARMIEAKAVTTIRGPLFQQRAA